MPDETKAYLRRVNPAHRAFEADLTKLMLDQLRMTSIAPADLLPPYAAPVRAILDRHLDEQRAILDAYGPRPTRAGKSDAAYRLLVAVRVVVGASFLLETKSPTTICAFLNDGNQNEREGLTVDSVRSVWRMFRRSLKAEGGIRLPVVVADIERLRALYSLQQRIPGSRFAGLRGARLAQAIHDDFDLNESIWLAQRRMAAERKAGQARKSDLQIAR
jgi:hypothetical protein